MNFLLRQLNILRTMRPVIINNNKKPIPLIFRTSFSSSPSTQWKSIGSPNKNRKTRAKLKTHQGASKRFFVTGKGQFKRVQAGTQHLMTGLTQNRKRKLKPMVIVKKSQTSLLRKLLPYAGKRAGFRKLDQSESVWWKSGKLQKSGALQQAINRSNRLKRYLPPIIYTPTTSTPTTTTTTTTTTI
ncbi:hypothetical protein PSTT_13956 [Puccinia striiformis]|uniref:50S ribosomal protein L35 n=1 Tax=Puccinia striiformis TaxID=27350 RepID=A0A2S4UPF4_9BASI|nr:hypothetical protein PSTT_13956 [Puccinia striiformis]